MRLQCDPRLATRLGSGMGEAGWRPVCGARRERLVGATTRLWSEKELAGWSEDPSVEREGRG